MPSADAPILCGRCGYDVRGLPGHVCPECGGDLREVGVYAKRPVPRWVWLCVFSAVWLPASFLLVRACAGLSGFRIEERVADAGSGVVLSDAGPSGGVVFEMNIRAECLTFDRTPRWQRPVAEAELWPVDPTAKQPQNRSARLVRRPGPYLTLYDDGADARLHAADGRVVASGPFGPALLTRMYADAGLLPPRQVGPVMDAVAGCVEYYLALTRDPTQDVAPTREPKGVSQQGGYGWARKSEGRRLPWVLGLLPWIVAFFGWPVGLRAVAARWEARRRRTLAKPAGLTSPPHAAPA